VLWYVEYSVSNFTEPLTTLNYVVTRRTTMSSTFVCLSSLFTPAHWLSPDTKHHITNFMSVLIPSCSSKYHIPDSSLSLKNRLYLSYFPAPRQVLSVSPITCVPSFSPHPENNIWPSFSSLCAVRTVVHSLAQTL